MLLGLPTDGSQAVRDPEDAGSEGSGWSRWSAPRTPAMGVGLSCPARHLLPLAEQARALQLLRQWGSSAVSPCVCTTFNGRPAHPLSLHIPAACAATAAVRPVCARCLDAFLRLCATAGPTRCNDAHVPFPWTGWPCCAHRGWPDAAGRAQAPAPLTSSRGTPMARCSGTWCAASSTCPPLSRRPATRPSPSCWTPATSTSPTPGAPAALGVPSLRHAWWTYLSRPTLLGTGDPAFPYPGCACTLGC